MIFKILIFVLLGLILASLASGVFFLARDNGKTNRVVTSLTVRITLSLLLFFTLIAGWLTGAIVPHGL